MARQGFSIRVLGIRFVQDEAFEYWPSLKAKTPLVGAVRLPNATDAGAAAEAATPLLGPYFFSKGSNLQPHGCTINTGLLHSEVKVGSFPVPKAIGIKKK